MSAIFRIVCCFVVLAVAGCDEIAVANDPEALADLRGRKSCLRAVTEQTGAAGLSVNTTIPVIETNYYIIDVPNASSWTCVTDDTGAATQIVERNA